MGTFLRVPKRLMPLGELALLEGRTPTKEEWRTWVLESDAYWRDGEGVAVRVPRLFMTDFASIPWMFRWWKTGGTGPQRVAAYFHDWLYSSQSEYDQKESDRIFREVMRYAGGGWFARWAMYLALRVGGWLAWRKNQARLKACGPTWRLLDSPS